jgi:Fe-S oxidoreductase
MARRAIGALTSGHYRTVLFGCRSCQRQLAQRCRDAYGLQIPTGIEVLHATQYIERLLKEGRLRFGEEPARPASGRVTYHDPCALGRAGLDLYEALRAILRAAGAVLVEMEFNRQHARCCGSARLRETYPNIAAPAAANTLDAV